MARSKQSLPSGEQQADEQPQGEPAPQDEQPQAEAPQGDLPPQERQNEETQAVLERRDEVAVGKAAAEREELPPDRVDEAARLKEEDASAPSVAQVADSSATMERVPQEGEPEEAVAERARANALADPANPGQPAGAVYPDRTA